MMHIIYKTTVSHQQSINKSIATRLNEQNSIPQGYEQTERMAFGQHEGVHETLNTSEVKRPKFVI